MRQILLVVVCVSYISLIATTLVQSRTLTSQRDSSLEEQDQEEFADFLDRLEQNLLHNSNIENVKRNLDLGFSRGFSGSQAAKHLMGLAAANFAHGPGRKRRSANAVHFRQNEAAWQ